MRRLIVWFILVATPAAAVDLPPPVGPGAPLRERFYLASESAGDLSLLAARIECVAHHRARIEAFAAERRHGFGWSHEAERLWRIAELLDRFEAEHIRRHVDRETQAALAQAYVGAQETVTAPGDDRAERCRSFGDIYALRRLAG